MKLVTFTKWIQLFCFVQYVAYDAVSQMLADPHGPSFYVSDSHGSDFNKVDNNTYGSSGARRPSAIYSAENRPMVKMCNADCRKPWSYKQRNGPSSWGNKYHTCNGNIQSPIAIATCDLIKDRGLPKLAMHGYDIPITKATIQNNGRTVYVTPEDKVQRTIHVDGTTYILSQLHFHWGEHHYGGSEHTIDGTQYAMELHFVHKSVKKNVAVVAVFFQEWDNVKNNDLRPITDILSQVTFKNMKTQLRNRLNLNCLLPANPCSFFRYMGSLTTPGCEEGVIWSLLPYPFVVGTEQMAEFRKLYTTKRSEASSNCKISDNFRPVQALNYRTVLVSQ